MRAIPVLAVALSAGLVVALGAAYAPPVGAPAEGITRAELGRLLFWDPILSGPKDVACASCHHPDFAYADGRALSLGTGSVGLGPNRVDASGGDIPVVPRNSPTILNTAFNGIREGQGDGLMNIRVPSERLDASGASAAPMFWDNRVQSLELQALEPLKVREEMRGDAFPEEVAIDSIVARLRAIPGYVQRFEEAFGPTEGISAVQLAQAIAEFERTLVATDSPFDRFQAGEQGALTPQELRGRQAFEDANCTLCHSGPMLSDFSLRADGVPEHPLLTVADEGDGRFRFRTPSLRNVALTAPYMHNGMLETLEDVLRFYDRRRSENPNVADRPRRPTEIANGGPSASLDWDFRFLNDVTEGNIQDIISFLEALTDSDFDRTIPTSVPSGLAPGGALASR